MYLKEADFKHVLQDALHRSFLSEASNYIKKTPYNKKKVDPNKVSLYNDPKVRSGDEWVKYGGNFPIERNGHIYYVSRSIAVSLYCYCRNSAGEWCILANQRGQGAQNANGLWNVPAGYLDYNESAPYAAKRETWEETGVNVPIRKIHMMGMNSGQLETDDDIANRKLMPVNGKQDVSVRFAAVLDGTIDRYPVSNANCEPGEVADIKWIPLSKVKGYKWAYGQGDKVLAQARTSLGDYSNPNSYGDLNFMITQLKQEISNNPSALSILDKILKKLGK